MSGVSAVGYRQALACLYGFVLEHPEISGASPTVFLYNWIVSMFWRGFTAKTAIHYLDLISSLHSSAERDGEVEITDAFRVVKAKTRELAPEIWNKHISEDDFLRFANFTKLAGKVDENLAVFADIVIFSLINKGMSFADVANLKCSDLSKYGDDSVIIAQKYAEPRRKYVFPLRQSYRTPHQLEKYVKTKILHLLLSRNIAVPGGVEDAIRSYWAYAALKCGVSGTAVVNELGSVPEGLPILHLCSDGMSIPAADKSADIASVVSGVFLSNPVDWYAMRLRHGVKFDSLIARFSALKGEIMQPELFYPIEEIARRLKKRIVYKEVPVLPGIIFFRSRLTDIQPLFVKIGDLAWCYKNGNAYSSISSSEMERFQQAIGSFTPATEIRPVGTYKPEKNDRVEILGGMFAGRSARFDSALTGYDGDGSARMIYRLLLPSGNGIEWVVDLDSRLVRVAADKKV